MGWVLTGTDENLGNAVSQQEQMGSPEKGPLGVSSEEASARILLKSRPAGAAIYQDGRQVGALPREIPRPSTDEKGTVYRLKLDGYQDLDLVVTATMPEEFVAKMMPLAAPVVSSDGEKADPKTAPDARPKKREGGVKKKKKKRPKKKRSLSGDIVDPWS